MRHDPAVSAPRTVRVVPLVTTRALREPLDYLQGDGPDLEPGDVVHVPLAGRSVRGVVVEAGGASQHKGELAAVERLADEPRIAPARARAVPVDRVVLRLDARPARWPSRCRRACVRRATRGSRPPACRRRPSDGAPCWPSSRTARSRCPSWWSAPGRRRRPCASWRRMASWSSTPACASRGWRRAGRRGRRR